MPSSICEIQPDDARKIRAGIGTGLDGLEFEVIRTLWNAAMDGVDNMLPDMLDDESHTCGTPFRLTGARRAFEINRRVVLAVQAMYYGNYETEMVEPPASLSPAHYDNWIGEHEDIATLYQVMKYDFIQGIEYDTCQVYQTLSHEFYLVMGGVKYKLSEVGQ